MQNVMFLLAFLLISQQSPDYRFKRDAISAFRLFLQSPLTKQQEIVGNIQKLAAAIKKNETNMIASVTLIEDYLRQTIFKYQKDDIRPLCSDPKEIKWFTMFKNRQYTINALQLAKKIPGIETDQQFQDFYSTLELISYVTLRLKDNLPS